MAEAQDLRIQNTAVGALVKIGDVESLLSHVNKRTARLALMRLHQPEVISGIAASLQQSQGSERMGLIEILARLFYREAEWDLKAWWGTRPDDRGPYFAPEAWEETRNIKAALESVFDQLSKTDQSKMLGILGLNRVPVSELRLGKQDSHNVQRPPWPRAETR